MKNRGLRLLIAAGLFGLMMSSASTALCGSKQAPPKDAEPASDTMLMIVPDFRVRIPGRKACTQW